MARKARNTHRAKEPVKLRMKKLANGNTSLYLDTYRNGARHYEFLKLYLIPETNAAARTQNANTLQAAQAIKSRRILELVNRKAGITDRTEAGRITVGQLVEAYRERKARSRSASLVKQIRCLLRYLETWKIDRVCLADFDRPQCLRLIDRFNQAELKPTTKANYFHLFSTIFNDAVRGGLIASNPFNTLENGERLRRATPEREYLTVEEVQRLAAAPVAKTPALCDKWEDVKRAFMFACFCGLRVSDLAALKWDNLQRREGYTEIRVRMQKTRQEVIVPLSDEACRWLPERPPFATGKSPVFCVSLGCYSRELIGGWAKAAGINKRVGWHTARHTFATMLLTRGADIYTVSKLLGHSSVTITQIYAKVIDSKKVEAVNLLNGISEG